MDVLAVLALHLNIHRSHLQPPAATESTGSCDYLRDRNQLSFWGSSYCRDDAYSCGGAAYRALTQGDHILVRSIDNRNKAQILVYSGDSYLNQCELCHDHATDSQLPEVGLLVRAPTPMTSNEG